MSVVMQTEMPNGCHDCKLRNIIGNCPIPRFEGLVDEKKIWTLAECFQRPPWCPIICQLPEGHGDLVDADAVESTIKKWFYEIKLNPDILLDGVKSLPTIVPAEAERRETCLD